MNEKEKKKERRELKGIRKKNEIRKRKKKEQ